MSREINEVIRVAQQVALTQMSIELIGKVDSTVVQEARNKALLILEKSYD